MPDLCQLADVKAWLTLSNNAADAMLTQLISAVSADLLREFDRNDFTPAADYQDVITLQSHNLVPVLPAYWNTKFQGIGEFKVGLNHWPVNSILSVILDGNTVPQSPDGIQPGWFFAADQEPEYRDTLLIIGQYVRMRQSKLSVIYNAGYATPQIAAPPAPVLSSVPGGTLAGATYYGKLTYSTTSGETTPGAEASLAVAINNMPAIAAPVNPPPTATGYNVYLALATNAETKQNLVPIPLDAAFTLPTTGLIAGVAVPSANTSASAIPLDVVQAAIEWTAFRYRMRESLGKASVHMQQGESVTFDKNAMPPTVKDVIDFYSRSAGLDF